MPIELAELAHKSSIRKRNNTDVYLYNKSNENLYEIFNHYDFNNKEVLSILASSD